jgi:hypothetical protein
MNLVAGLTLATGPRNLNRVKGRLTTPKDFDDRKYVGKWVKKGHGVEMARQPTHTIDGRFEITGWEVFKGENSTTCERTLTDGVYVLMFRSKALAHQLHRINGNISKYRAQSEAENKTVGGQTLEDTGMLSARDLSSVERGDGEPAIKVEFNSEDREPEARVSTRAKSAIKLK